MAKKITKDEIFEKGLLSDVINEAEKAIVVFDKLDVELGKVSKSYKSIIDNSSKNSKGSITELVNASKALNQITEETVRIEKEKLKIDREIRITRKEQLSAEQSLQRQRERSIAQMEKEAKKVAEAERPYNKMSATLNDLRKKYKDLAVTGNENTASARAMKREIDSLDKALKKADGSVGQFQRNVGNYPQTFKAIGSALSQLGLAFGVFSTIRGIAETEIKLQSLQLALKNVMGTQEKYNQSFAFLSELSRNYGQDLTVLVDTYKGFIASSESSNLSLEARNKIYQSVIKSGSSLALSNDQIQGSLLAISQMFSKGTVSAEELRGQLGERLPGAFGIMAKSMGVSEQQLGKMMQKGEVMAKDVLPKFAEELEKTFGANASKNLETIGGAWNVLQTEISLYINEANKGGAITKQIAGAISFLAKNIDTIVSVLGKAIKGWIAFKVAMYAINLKEQFDQWKGLKGAVNETADGLNKAEKGAGKFGNALKGIGIAFLITQVVDLGTAIYDMVKGFADAERAINSLRSSTEKGNKEISTFIDNTLNGEDKLILALDKRAQKNKMSKKQYKEELEDIKKGTKEKLNAELQIQIQSKKFLEQNLKDNRKEYEEILKITPINRTSRAKQILGMFETSRGEYNKNIIAIKALRSALFELDKEEVNNTISIEKNTKKIKENTKERKDAKEQIDALIESMQKLDDFYIENSIEENSKRLAQAIDLEMTKIGNSGEYSIDIINRIIEAEAELQKAVIERAYQTDIANAQNTADYELAEAKRNKALQDLEESTVNKKKETNKQLELEQERYAENQYKTEEERLKKEKELKDKADDAEKKRLEEMRNFRRQMLNELLDELKRQSEAREDQYEKDIQTQKDFQGQLQAQANAGNITAQQSIAQSIENEKKATLAKEKEQKKQQRIDDMKTLFNLINQNIDKGDNAGIATVKATASMALIKSIAGMFKGFAKGTKWRLGQEDNPLMSGVDGHIVRVDSSEAIVNGGLMNKAEKAGIRSTEQLVNSAIMYQTFNPNSIKMNDDRQAFNSASIEPITQRLESLEQTIKNKTEFRIEPYILHGIHKGIVQIQKDGNLTRKTIIKS